MWPSFHDYWNSCLSFSRDYGGVIVWIHIIYLFMYFFFVFELRLSLEIILRLLEFLFVFYMTLLEKELKKMGKKKPLPFVSQARLSLLCSCKYVFFLCCWCSSSSFWFFFIVLLSFLYLFWMIWSYYWFGFFIKCFDNVNDLRLQYVMFNLFGSLQLVLIATNLLLVYNLLIARRNYRIFSLLLGFGLEP